MWISWECKLSDQQLLHTFLREPKQLQNDNFPEESHHVFLVFFLDSHKAK